MKWVELVKTLLSDKTALSLVLVILFPGCGASTRDVIDTIGPRYHGRTVDEMVMDLGPPDSITPMHNGDKLYEFRLASFTQVNAYKGGATASTHRCILHAMVSADGTVEYVQIKEDAPNGINQSLCADRLGIKKRN